MAHGLKAGQLTGTGIQMGIITELFRLEGTFAGHVTQPLTESSNSFKGSQVTEDLVQFGMSPQVEIPQSLI